VPGKGILTVSCILWDWPTGVTHTGVTPGVKLVKTILLGFADEGSIVYCKALLSAKIPNSYFLGLQDENSSADPEKAIKIIDVSFMTLCFKYSINYYQPGFCVNVPDDKVIWSLGIC